MKNYFIILISIITISCGGGNEKLNLPDITISTTSEEAKNAFLDAMYNFETRGSDEQRRTLLNQAITIDPDFLLAKAALYSFVGTESNNSVLESVYEERNKVSDMEAKIIEFFYNRETSNDPEIASYNITMLTDEYPELWRLWYWSGHTKSRNYSEIYEAIDDLETALEINPNHFGTKLELITKHLQVGGFGFQLPSDEIDMDYLETMVYDLEKTNPDLGFTYVILGNYNRAVSNFDEAIKYYAKLEQYQDQGIEFLNQSIFYRALVNTFRGDYDEALKFFRRHLELGNNSYTWISQMYLFKNDFEGAIDILNEFEENLVSLELPAQQELNALVNINRAKFLCYAHNQVEDESFQHIRFTKEAQINAINLRKNRIPDNIYNEQIQIANYVESTNLIWHDILFGNYDEAKNKLIDYKDESEKINRPNNMHNFYVLNALADLNLGDPESSIKNFNLTTENNGFPGIPLDSDYYTYFKALALKANGETEESNALFDEIATNNFFGFQRALVRNLAIAQL